MAKENISLQELLSIINLASETKSLEETAQNQFEKRKNIKQKLIAAGKEKGQEIKESQIEEAINKYYAQKYSFKEPANSISTTFAEFYVDRKKIAKRMRIPFILTLTGLTATYGAYQIYNLNLEKKIEGKLESQCRVMNLLKKSLAEDLSSPFLKQLPADEVSSIESHKKNAELRFAYSGKILDKYCPKGSAKESVTAQNIEHAKLRSNILETEFEEINKEINFISGKLQFQENLASIKLSLDQLIQNLNDSTDLEYFREKAQNFYTLGINNVKSRNLNEAREYESNLKKLKSDFISYNDSIIRIANLYAANKSLAIEEKAKEKNEGLHNESKKFADSFNISQLEEAVSEFSKLGNILESEYEIRIVSNPEERSGIERFYEENGNVSSESRFYLIVQAFDSNGEIISREISNEETQQQSTVTKWGERVPESVYLEVKADKSDGILEKYILIKKRKGWLNEECRDNFKREGQITEWEDD
ncbi:MAG: DUF6384 family protein [Nanoarchaeota archaeon]